MYNVMNYALQNAHRCAVHL